MKVLIDACVLFPTLLRDLVLTHAATGAFEPLWSARILEEWRRAAARKSQTDGEIASVEIAAITARFPNACVPPNAQTESRLSLPDPDDVHVLAAAITAGADELLTFNIKDFPTRTLSGEGILRRDPDGFLLEAYHANPSAMSANVDAVLTRAKAHGIDVSNTRAILKRARVPRLAKALSQV
ncbi:MAG: PIN domain-containing protein [Paracoccaceae bacterium]